MPDYKGALSGRESCWFVLSKDAWWSEPVTVVEFFRVFSSCKGRKVRYRRGTG